MLPSQGLSGWDVGSLGWLAIGEGGRFAPAFDLLSEDERLDPGTWMIGRASKFAYFDVVAGPQVVNLTMTDMRNFI